MIQTTSTAHVSFRQRLKQSRTWQTLRTASWLEWQSQGNWTNPWLFLLYLVAKPLTAALVLVFMYWVISGYHAHGAFFSFLIVGSSTWSFVEQIISGLPRAVLDDRELYAMLKYVYITPQSYITFLIGRSAPRLLAGFLSFVITLVFGVLILGVPINLLRVNYLLLLLALVLGFVGIVALGIALAGLSLVMKRNAWVMPDAMSGALYLLAGTIFPIAILPGWLQKISLGIPLTYWLELIRRAMLGDAIGATFPVASTSAIVGLLILTTVLATFICSGVYRLCDYLARERGQIDRTTGY